MRVYDEHDRQLRSGRTSRTVSCIAAMNTIYRGCMHDVTSFSSHHSHPNLWLLAMTTNGGSASLTRSDVFLFAVTIGGTFLALGLSCSLCAWLCYRRRRRHQRVLGGITARSASGLEDKDDTDTCPILWETHAKFDHREAELDMQVCLGPLSILWLDGHLQTSRSWTDLAQPLALFIIDHRIHFHHLIKLPSDGTASTLALGSATISPDAWDWRGARWLNKVERDE